MNLVFELDSWLEPAKEIPRKGHVSIVRLAPSVQIAEELGEFFFFLPSAADNGFRGYHSFKHTGLTTERGDKEY